MMIQHGRVMTEYAAYNAVRAGIVHNANWNVMQNAAMISALPIYKRTDRWDRFLRAWAEVKAVSEATQAADMTMGTLERLAGDLLGVHISGFMQDISLIEVNVTSPKPRVFNKWRTWIDRQQSKAKRIDQAGPLVYPEGGREIDFDDVNFFDWLSENDGPGAGRLAVEVRILYPLRIPVINSLIFQLWWAQSYLRARRIESDITEWAAWRGRIQGGLASGQYLDEAMERSQGGPLDDLVTTRQWTKELRTLRWLAAEQHVYLIPLKASYAMQMQSNFFEKNQSEPVWFTLE